MSISSLKGTKWVLNTGIDGWYEYYNGGIYKREFSDYDYNEGSYSIRFTSNGNTFDSIWFGDADHDSYGIYYGSTQVQNGTVWLNGKYRVVSITGGDDVSNPALIQWFETYGTRVKIADLTDTDWVLNKQQSFDDMFSQAKSINFTCYGVNTANYTTIGFDSDNNETFLYLKYSDTTVYSSENGGTWSQNYYRAIHISAPNGNVGTDVNDPDLILWLLSHAKPLIDDLTGTQWLFDETIGTVPSTGRVNLSFESNNTQYASFYPSNSGDSCNIEYESTAVYDATDGWANEKFRSVLVTGGSGATNGWLRVLFMTNAEPEESTATRLYKVLKAKNAIKTVLESKGVTVGDAKFEEYADIIANIPAILQQKTVTPTTSQQTIEPDAGYDGISRVTVSAVTSAIDPDIVAANIVNGVNILGVTGTAHVAQITIDQVNDVIDLTIT